MDSVIGKDGNEESPATREQMRCGTSLKDKNPAARGDGRRGVLRAEGKSLPNGRNLKIEA